MKSFSLGRFLRRVWRWSLLLTIPVALVFLIWVSAVASRYSDFGLRHPMVGSDSFRLHKIGKMEWDHLVRKAEIFLTRRPGQKMSGLKQMHLFLPEATEARLDQDLPHSGRGYVRGHLLYPDGVVREIKTKYRGDFWWHWGFYKKSLRVRTKKDELFQGMRSFNLIVPKFNAQVNNHLAYRMAKLMGLMAPRSEMVNLWINGGNRGLFAFVEQLEEMTLRHNKRMPGDVYSGELVARDRYTGIKNDLFLHPRVWEKVAINNHYHEESYAPLEALLAKIPGVNFPTSGVLRDVLDRRVWGRFLAYEVLTQTYHFSKGHNWRLYYDPAKNKFEPIVWDPDGWHPQWRPKKGQTQFDIRVSRLHDALLADSDFLLARQHAIDEFFASGLDRKFLDEFDQLARAMDSDLSKDPGQVTNFRHLQPSDVREAMRKLRVSMVNIFADVKREYIDDVSPVKYAVARRPSRAIELVVNDRRAISGLRLDYKSQVDRIADVRLGYLSGGEPVEIDLAGAVSLRGHSLTIDMPLVANFIPSTSRRRPPRSKVLSVKPAYYWLDFGGEGELDSLVNIYAMYSDGASVRAKRVRKLQDETDAAVTVGAPVVPLPPVQWSGKKLVNGTLVIKSDLVIKPGTEVLLRPDSSVIIEGQLIAEGTKRRPIKFIPAGAGQDPWGAVVLRGQGSTGSVLKHCEFAFGSGHKTDLFEYSAMLSIHDVGGVTVSDCYFHDSQVVDDMVRAVYSQVELRDSVFENALFDAVDFDIVEGLVERCTFKGSGNDALDLMESRVVVAGSQMVSAGDKGISVGEGTVLFAVNNLLEDNLIGVEGKDSSQAFLLNSSFVGNGVALNAYHKNWRYDRGGTIYLGYGDVRGAGAAVTVGKRSKIYILDSDIRGEVEESSKIVMQSGGFERSLPEFAGKHRAKVEPSQRGWSPDAN